MGLNSVHPSGVYSSPPNLTPAPGNGQHVSEKFELRKVHQSSQSHVGTGPQLKLKTKMCTCMCLNVYVYTGFLMSLHTVPHQNV